MHGWKHSKTESPSEIFFQGFVQVLLEHLCSRKRLYNWVAWVYLQSRFLVTSNSAPDYEL